MSASSAIEKFWYSNSQLKWLFLPLSLVFVLLAQLKRSFYRAGIFQSRHSGIPVVVVGNITVGGTGKTPFIAYLIKQLKAKGLKVAVVSRGYLSQAPEYPHIVTATDSVQTIGDEAFMQYQLSKVPMAIGANRSAAIEQILKHYKIDLIISDDGLQHYSMARNIEILMIDASRWFGNQLMLPFGPLREPVSRIRSVDFIVLNGASELSEQASQQSFMTELDLPVANMQMKIESLVKVVSGESVPIARLNQEKFTAVAGIGNPTRFFNTLQQAGLTFECKVFPDHYQFKAEDFEGIKESVIVMTEKDAVKCREFAQDNWFYVKVHASIAQQQFDVLYQSIEHQLLNKA